MQQRFTNCAYDGINGFCIGFLENCLLDDSFLRLFIFLLETASIFFPENKTKYVEMHHLLISFKKDLQAKALL